MKTHLMFGFLLPLLTCCEGAPSATDGDVAGSGQPPERQTAVDRGLAWLAAHQDEDGRWDCDGFMKHDGDAAVETAGAGSAVHDVGATGLAVLAFLGAGNTMRSGPYRDQVKAGVRWLIGQQDEESGLVGTAQSHDFIYGHAIATWALCEAYGLSNYKLIKNNAQRGLNYLERHRNPYGVWRYQPRDGDNDTSVTTWCVMAYCAGRDFELEIHDNALKVALQYYEQVTDPETGRHGYTKRGERSSRMPGMHASNYPVKKNEALTGAGLFARFLLGQEPAETPVMDKAAALLNTCPPAWTPDAGNIDLYAWYWASLALYQCGGDAWQAWSPKLSEALLAGQRQDGAAAGSWDPISVWSELSGRVGATALATLSLETYYRYGRLVR